MLEKSIGEQFDVLQSMAFDETVADYHGRKHHLTNFRYFESHGREVVKFLIVTAHQLSPPYIAHTVEISVAAVNAQ